MPREVHDARRADIRWDGAPTLLLQTTDGTWWRHQLSPSETAATIKRLAGYLAALHPPANADRTDETIEANPDIADYLEGKRP